VVAMLVVIVFVVGFVLLAFWVARKKRQHPGNMLRPGGSAFGANKHADPLDRTDTQ
jgi:hypothetical protein